MTPQFAEHGTSIVVTCLVAVFCLVLVDVTKMLSMRPLVLLIEKLP